MKLGLTSRKITLGGDPKSAYDKKSMKKLKDFHSFIIRQFIYGYKL